MLLKLARSLLCMYLARPDEASPAHMHSLYVVAHDVVPSGLHVLFFSRVTSPLELTLTVSPQGDMDMDMDGSLKIVNQWW